MQNTETMVLETTHARSKEVVYNEMKETLGLVPIFFRSLPESVLDLEWQAMKKTQMEETAIPAKYRELAGLAVAAATRCQYCTLFHTEMAKVAGASREEIEEASRLAKMTMGWSTYLNGMQIDYDQFKKEILQIANYAKSMHKNK